MAAVGIPLLIRNRGDGSERKGRMSTATDGEEGFPLSTTLKKIC